MQQIEPSIPERASDDAHDSHAHDSHVNEQSDPALLKSVRVNLCCNTCNRDELHVLLPSLHRISFPLTILLTFGLVYIVGPYRCVCCGNRKFLSFVRNANKPRMVSKRLLNLSDHDVTWEREVRAENRTRRYRKLMRPFRKLGSKFQSFFTRRNMRF